MRAGSGCIDVGPCPTHQGASAASDAGSGAAREVAFSGGQSGDFCVFAENDCVVMFVGLALRVRLLVGPTGVYSVPGVCPDVPDRWEATRN